MKLRKFIPILAAVSLIVVFLGFIRSDQKVEVSETSGEIKSHWFILHRKSNTEELFYGTPGDREESELMKEFEVKVGVPGQSPTPLPNILGREYWSMTDKWEEEDNLETGPFFLLLDIDAPSVWPFGPTPYLECNGQCDWGKPGYFGLHGIGDDPTRLDPENEGSLGCVRHRNEDITYLYNLLDPKNGEIRYYVEDN